MNVNITRINTARACIAAAALMACAGQGHGAQDATIGAGSTEVLDTGVYEAPNGDLFTFTKAVAGEHRTVTYERDGVAYSPDELRAYEAAHPLPVIDDALLNRAKLLVQQTPLRVVVAARSSPWRAIASRVRQDRQPAIDAMGDEIRAIYATLRPQGSLSPEQEQDWINRGGAPAALTPAQQARIQQLSDAIEAQTLRARDDTRDQVAVAVAADQKALRALVAALGGNAEASILSLNAVVATLPAGSIGALAADPRVRRVFEETDGGPALDQSVASLGVPNGFWSSGVTGTTWDVAILDTEGVQTNHPALNGHIWNVYPGLPLASVGDGHGTAVAGIIASTDPTYRGVAYGVQRILYGRGGQLYTHADWIATAAPDDPEVFNLSWQYGVHTADYTHDTAKFVDSLVDDFSLSFCVAAGNEGSDASTLTNPAQAYNAITVANVFFASSVTRTDDSITTSSSRGPVLSTGRCKPDLAAPGQGVESCNDDWAGAGANWTGFGGTSAASPHVAGGAILVANKRGSDNPAPVKAVLINTADTWTDGGTLLDKTDDGPAAGSQWNATFGWGYTDLGEADFNAADVFVSTIDDGVTPPGPDHKFYKGRLFANEKATLVWNRHSVYEGTEALPSGIAPLTDLDLRLYDQENGALLDSSTTVVNNVEQVGVTATHDVVVKVDCFGQISPLAGATESFALAVEENFDPATGPSLASVLADTTGSPGVDRVIRVVVGNSGDLPAHNVTVNLGALPAGWVLVSGADTQNIGTIGSGGFLNIGVAQWRVRPGCATPSGTFTWTVSSNSYGEVFTDSGSGTVTIEAPTALASDAPVTDTDVSKTWSYGLDANEWSVVSVGVPSGDHDVRVDQSQCMSSPIESSAYPGATTDFVVLNGRTYGNATQYANVYFGDNTSYTLEFEDAFDILVGNQTAVAFDAPEPVELFEIPLVAGTAYRLVLTATGGTADAAISIFRAGRSFGARDNADARTDIGGPGEGENRAYTATTTGVHAIVVAHDNRNSGTFTLRVTCAADFDGSGAVNVADIFAFLGAWFENHPAADFDASGGVNVADIFTFLSAWFAGC